MALSELVRGAGVGGGDLEVHLSFRRDRLSIGSKADRGSVAAKVQHSPPAEHAKPCSWAHGARGLTPLSVLTNPFG